MNKIRIISLNDLIKWIAVCFLIFSAAYVLYAPTTDFELVWDDKTYIGEMGAHRGSDYISQTFSSSFFVSSDYYRPLVQLSLLSQWRAYENAGTLHATNVSIHVLNTVMVLLLSALAATRLGMSHQRHLISAISSFIYMSHPVLVEPVVWISGRFDLAMTFFVLLVLCVERCWKNARLIKFVFIGALFFFAALSKEMAVALPLLMPFWLMFWREAEGNTFRGSFSDRYALKIYAILIAAGSAYLAVRYVGVGSLYKGLDVVGGTLDKSSLLQKMLLVAKSYGWYLALAFWPFPNISVAHEDSIPISLGDMMAWSSVLLVLALLFIAVFMWRRGAKESMFLIIALIALLPASNLLRLPVAENIVHDRFLTLPLAFLSMFIAIGAVRFTEKLNGVSSVVMMVLLAGWVAFLPANARLIIPMWKDDLTLWSWTLYEHPASYMANANILSARLKLGLYDGCDELSLKVLKIKESAIAYQYRGTCLFELGRPADAEVALIKALDFDIAKEEYAMNLVNIAEVQLAQQKGEDILSLLAEAERIFPGYYKIYWVGARFLDRNREFSSAEVFYRKLLPLLTSKEKPIWDSYLQQRQICIEQTGSICPEFQQPSISRGSSAPL